MAASKKKKYMVVAGIAGAAFAAYWFLFRTKTGKAAAATIKNAVNQMFDLAPSFGTPEWDKYAAQQNGLLSAAEVVINADFGKSIKEGDRAEVAQIIATRLMRNYKTLDVANRNTLTQLIRMDPAYQKMLATYQRTGFPWAGGSADA